jgi:hypothetical protein
MNIRICLGISEHSPAAARKLFLLGWMAVAMSAGCQQGEHVSGSAERKWAIGLVCVGRPSTANLITMKIDDDLTRPIIERRALKTVESPTSVWITRDGSLYAATEGNWDRNVRVYDCAGGVLGEYHQQRERLGAPVISEVSKRVAFLTSSGSVIVGAMDARGSYSFTQVASLAGVGAAPLISYELVLFDNEDRLILWDGSTPRVFSLDVHDGHVLEVGQGQLVGLANDAPVLFSRAARTLSAQDTAHHPVTWEFSTPEPYSPGIVFRTSPCGDFVAYAVAGYGPGFRLKLVHLTSRRAVVLEDLGPVERLGSWWCAR